MVRSQVACRPGVLVRQRALGDRFVPLIAAILFFVAKASPVMGAPAVLLNSIAARPPSLSAAGDSTTPVMSADGRFLVFLSDAGDLVTNRTSLGLLNVFRQEIATGETTLVSVNTNSAGGNGRSYQATVSADGQVIVFTSEASDLVAGDTNLLADVFVRNMTSSVTRLLVRGFDGSAANGPSSAPTISQDGRYACFQTEASNLLPEAMTRETEVYRADLATGELTWASPHDTNAILRSWSPQSSDDGSKVVFFNWQANEFVSSWVFGLAFRDLSATTNLPLSGHFGPPIAGWISPTVALSGDGRYLLFGAYASAVPSPTNSGLSRVDIVAGLTNSVAPELDALEPLLRGVDAPLWINRDGSLILFQAALRQPTNTPAAEAVYAWDASTGKASLVTTNTVRVADTPASQPFGRLATASADGRFVAWSGYATNEAAFPNNEPLQLFVTDRSGGETRLITRTPSGAASATGLESSAVSFSDDGNLVAFESTADDLIAGDANRSADIFVYDWNLNRLKLVSRRTDAFAPAPAPGFYSANADSLSADGRFLVYLSSAQGATSDDLKDVPNVFVRDLAAGTNRLVSFGAVDGSPAKASCQQAIPSADGRWAAFSSLASNLVANDTNGLSDLFVRDLVAGTTWRASARTQGDDGVANPPSIALAPDGSRVAFVSSGGSLFVFELPKAGLRLVSASTNGTPAGGPSYHPLFSPDGAWLVFESTAPDLLPDVAPVGPQVYAWRASDGTLRRLTSEDSANRNLPRPIAFSGDGHVVAFDVLRPDGLSLVLHDFGADLTTDLVGNATAPSLNADGTRVAYLTAAASPAGSFPEIQLLDRAKNTTNLVSIALGGSDPGNGTSFSPLLTPDGRFVIFSSQATNLVAGDNNASADVFVRNLQNGTTLVLSQSLLSATPGNALSAAPILGRDGRTIVFSSFATDLVKGVASRPNDLLVARLPGAESDFRITSITRVSNGQITLVWTATQGVTYRLDYCDGLGLAWQPFNTSIQIQGDQATAQDTTLGGRSGRFYRVAVTSP